jgi:hypothetical protein
MAPICCMRGSRFPIRITLLASEVDPGLLSLSIRDAADIGLVGKNLEHRQMAGNPSILTLSRRHAQRACLPALAVYMLQSFPYDHAN